MKKPDVVWVLFDELGLPEIFTTKAKADRVYDSWVKMFGKDGISKPVKYRRDK